MVWNYEQFKRRKTETKLFFLRVYSVHCNVQEAQLLSQWRRFVLKSGWGGEGERPIA